MKEKKITEAVEEPKVPGMKITIPIVILMGLFFIIRLGVTDEQLFRGNALSAGIFMAITALLLHLFLTGRDDYFIVTWLAFHFAPEIIKIPGFDLSIIGFVNAIFIPLMILRLASLRSRYFLAICALMLVFLTNLGVSNLRLLGSRVFEFISIILFFYFVLRKCRRPELIVRTALFIALLSVPFAVYQAIFQPEGGVFIDWRGARVFGVLFWPNLYSMYLLAPTVIAYYFMRQEPGLGKALAFASLVLANLLTWSRQGLMSLGLAIVVFELFYRKNSSRNSQAIKKFIVTAVVLMLLAVYQYSSDNVAEELKPTSISERTGIWNSVIPLIGNNWLFGNGLGSYELYRDQVVGSLSPHNQYLLMLFEIGILGLAIFLIFLAMAAFDLYSMTKDPLSRNYAGLGIAIMLGLMVISFVGNGFSEISALNGWIIVACTALLAKASAKSQAAPQNQAKGGLAR